jgi:hypothetical protein
MPGVPFEEMFNWVEKTNLELWNWNLPRRKILSLRQRYTYRVLQTIQMKLILLCVWAEPVVLGSTKTALKFKYEI